MVPKKIINFLEKNKVRHEQIKHRTVYTAYDKAKTLRVSEKIIGKTLVLKMDGKLTLVLIGANKSLDLQKLKKLAKAKKIDFATEKLIKNKFSGVKVGAIPPFGDLWKIPVFIDKTLAKEKEIIINGGGYNSSLKIKKGELKKLNLIPGNFVRSKK